MASSERLYVTQETLQTIDKAFRISQRLASYCLINYRDVSIIRLFSLAPGLLINAAEFRLDVSRFDQILRESGLDSRMPGSLHRLAEQSGRRHVEYGVIGPTNRGPSVTVRQVFATRLQFFAGAF